MDKNVECLCYHDVEAVEYFELLNMRYGDMNAVSQRVSSCLRISSVLVKLQAAVLQFCVI